MQCLRWLAPLAAGLCLYTVPAHAQHPLPIPAATTMHFESWTAAPLTAGSSARRTEQIVAADKNRKRQALIGGAIGAAAGFVLCTTISTLADDSADGGLSFCPLDSTLLIMGGGFAVGAAIGWAI